MDYVRHYLNVGNVIGQGAFGKVLLSEDQSSNARYALKCIHPLLKPQRLANELRHLRDLMGLCNVVQMHTANLSKGSLFIVMEFIESDKFIDIVTRLDQDEIKQYMRNLLVSLRYVHSRGIVHRDIKPGNFLYNREHKKFLLIDFGLAQSIKARPIVLTNNRVPARHHVEMPTPHFKKLRVDENKEPVRLTVGAYESPITHNDSSLKRKCITPNPAAKRRTAQAKCACRRRPHLCDSCSSKPESIAPKSGTPGFKAPEILLRYNLQSTPIDIWSAGVILACLFAGHYPIFRDVDDTDSLAEIIALLGSQNVSTAARALGIRLIVEPEVAPTNLRQLCKRIRQSGCDKTQIDLPDMAFDLLHRMMDPNPISRITAEAALNHPWLA